MIVRITDKSLLRRRIARSLRKDDAGSAFLMDGVVRELAERLSGVERAFPLAVASGGRGPGLRKALLGTGKVERVFRLEPVQENFVSEAEAGAVADDEALPLAPSSINLFVSALSLQWANDLPGALIQIRQGLRPDGLFLGALTGRADTCRAA
jgi:SAM-dependent methyltransferase